MDRETCEYNRQCKDTCPAYKAQCVRYCQRFTKSIVDKIGSTPITKEDLNEAPLLSKGVYSMLSKKKLISIVIKRLQKRLTPVKVYHFSTAIDAGLNEEYPSESIVVIDTTNKYKEAAKGMQVISGFAQKLGETKLVLVKAEAATIGEEVTVL